MSDIPPPPGQLIDIGGYRLHLQAQGHGSPAAVMDAGLTANSLFWDKALPAVAQITRAVTFDRAGYAWSEAAPNGTPRTSQQLVAEQRLLLERAGIQPPYILLGHSFGAINALVYAKSYPQEVAGLVLVDPSHPEMVERVPRIPSSQATQRISQAIATLGRLGLLRWLGPLMLRQMLPQGEQQLEPATWAALLKFASSPREYANAAREAGFGSQSFAQARSTPGSLGDLPIDVLTAEWWLRGKQNAMKAAFVSLHAELAALSSRGRHRVIPGSEHADLPTARPDEIAHAVSWVVDQS